MVKPVIGSNPIMTSFAAVAQLVERDLAKVQVAGSNPVCRSNKRMSYNGLLLQPSKLEMRVRFSPSAQKFFRYIKNYY